MVCAGASVASLLLLALSTPVHAQDKPPPPKNPEVLDDALLEAKFAAFVAQGDREREAGRLPEAANAYADALQIYKDPIIGGRLGVLLVQIGRPAQAADLLIDALERATKTSPEERTTFQKSYDAARETVCRVEVQVTEAHATISLDGRVKQMPDLTGFTLFLAPGEHELRARVKGFHDGVEMFNAPKGGDIKVTLTPLPIAMVAPPAHLQRDPSEAPKVNEPPDDQAEKREPIKGGVLAEQTNPGLRKTISAGPVMVLGVASWSPAVGGVLAGSLRPNDYVSIGLEGRAAWLTTGVGGEPINAMTAGALLNACGHYRWFFGCALGHLGVLQIDYSPRSYTGKSYSFTVPGLGGRVGAELHPAPALVVRGSLGALGLTRGVKLLAGQTIVADQPPLMLDVQISGGWEF